MVGLKGERVHACDMCERVFTRAEHLRRHKREVHGGVKRHTSTTSGVQASPILASSSGYSAGINDGLQYPAQTFHNTSYMTPPQVYVTMPQYSNPTATTLHPYAVNPGNAGFYPPNPPQGNPKSNLSTHTHYPYGNVNHQGSSQQGSEASKSKDDKKDKDKDKKVTKKDGHQK